jgi:chorismate dehydratase
MAYLNSEVFYHTLDPDSCDLVDLPPRAMAAAVESGELDGGPLPIAEVLRLGDKLRMVGDLGIACHGPAMSVFLFSDVPVEELSGRRIAVTSHTATSVQLLRVLAAELWHIEPILAGPDEPAPARLIIGDEAIRQSRTLGIPHTYDLSDEWRKLTGMPFVFAAWALRSDVPEESFKAFEKALTDAYCEGRQMVKEIAAARKTGYLPEEETAAYVRHFIYTIGDGEKRAIAEFKKRLAKLPVWWPEPVKAAAK